MTEDNINERIERISNCVAKAQLESALKDAADVSTFFQDKTLRNQFILISRQFYTNEEKYHKGVVANSEYLLEVAKISDAILSFQSVLHDHFLTKRKVTLYPSQSKIANPQTIIEVNNISKSVGDFSLKNIDFSLINSNILGIVGQNGSGKSTLLRIIAGRIPVDNGVVIYHGFENNDWYNIKGSIVLISQFVPEWKWDLKKTLKYYSIIRGGYQLEEADFEVEYLISRLALESTLTKKWEQLSGGEKSKWELARGLICRPKILLLDEPLAHLDPKSQIEFVNDLKNISRFNDFAQGIIITSHHIDILEMITDEIMFLENGAVKFYGNRSQIPDTFSYFEFDLVCNKPLEEINDIANYLNERIILRQNGNRFNILLPHEITPNQAISFFIEKGIEVYSFNDLTNSSKRFFYNEI